MSEIWQIYYIFGIFVNKPNFNGNFSDNTLKLKIEANNRRRDFTKSII